MTNFNTQDYDFLLRTLNQGSLIFKSQSLKRLLTLAINDKKQFLPITKQVLYEIQSLYYEDKEDINLNVTLILNEVVSFVTGRQTQLLIINHHIEHIIKNLGHNTKPNLRKASHTFLLAFLRAYNNFNSLTKAYTEYGLNQENTLVQQKAINSLQSILILQLKKFNWSSEESKVLFETLLMKTQDQNSYVAKAATQCLVSMCKIDEIKTLIKKLSNGYLTKTKNFLQNAIESLNVNTLKIIPEDVQGYIDNLNSKKSSNMSNSKKNIDEEQSKPLTKPQMQKYDLPSQKDMQTIKINPSNNNTQRRLEKIRNSIKNENKKSSMIDKEPLQSKLFGNLVLDGTIKEKTDAAEELLFKVQSNLDKPELQASIKAILPSLTKMLKDNNPKIVGIVLKILQTVIEFINPNDRNFLPLVGVIVEKLGDAKISIRQSVCKVIKQLIRKTKKGMWIHELIQNMKKNTNTFLRDQTLGLILSVFEETPKEEIDYDLDELLESIVIYADDPKTKIKIRTLDCLAQIVLVSQEIQKHNERLKSKMPTIFYQMYVEKVYKLQKEKSKLVNQEKEKSIVEPRKIKEEFSTTSRTAYEKINQSFVHKRNESEGDQNSKITASMDMVHRRVNLLKKPRGLMSTQQTTSIDNNNISTRTIDRSLDNTTIQDLDVILPSLYKKTTTNRFITRRKQASFSPNKTSQHKTSTSEYLSKDELTPLREPEKEFKEISNALKGSDWKVLFDTTNRLRRLIQFDANVVVGAGQSGVHAVMIDVLGLVENLRSSVAKNALLCLNELIIVLGKQVDSEIDMIFDKVIKKAADTNVFISAQVQKVMATLSTEATSSKVLDKISQFKDSKSIPTKETCVNCLMSMKDEQRIRQKDFVKLTESFAYYLFDGSQEIRNKAKAGVAMLCEDLGDWYRALRGKINPSYFKSICEIMTKPQAGHSKDLNQRYNTIRHTPKKTNLQTKQDFDTIKSQKISLPESPLKRDKAELLKKKIIKISNFPSEFQTIQTHFQQCSSSDWKKRIDSLNKVKELALQYAQEFMQYRSANHFIDIICKQIIEPNTKVSLNAMNSLQQVLDPLRPLAENNLSMICNSVFNCLSSNKPEIKQRSEQLTTLLMQQIETQSLLQYLTHGIMYSLPKSRVYLLTKLKDKIETIHQTKKQLLFKHVFPLMNKLMDEYKSEMIPCMVGVFGRLYECMGNQMYSHLTKFKEVKELVSR